MRRALLLVLAVSSGCTPEDFPVESLVDRLRMLGITASPPDLAPGETTQLTALVLDPTRPGRPTTFWLGCEPDPFNLNRSACADPSVVNDPSLLGSMTALPPGVKLIGVGDRAAYTAPRGLFDVLPADDPRRVTGTSGQVLGISVAEELPPAPSMEVLSDLFARVQRREVPSLVSLFRVGISLNPERNANPPRVTLTARGTPWPVGARVMMKPTEQVPLDLEAPDAAFEPFTAQTPNGPEARTERVLIAWYSTAGRFSKTRTALGEDVKTVLTAPGGKPFDQVPEKRTGTLWAVLRDTRGGLSWSDFPLFFCDEALPAVSVSAVKAPVTRADAVRLEGRELGSVLDVIVGGVALARGGLNPGTQTWDGELPQSLPPGTWPVVVHTRRCEQLDVGSIEVP